VKSLTKLLTIVVGFLVLGNYLVSLIGGLNPPYAVFGEEDEEYGELYNEMLPRVEELLNGTFHSPQARALQDIALRKYKDALEFVEEKSWRKAYDSLKGSYDILNEAVRAEESYLNELTIALMVVLPILILLHVVYLAHRRPSKR